MNSYKQISNSFNVIPTYIKIILSFIISLGLAFILGVQDLYVHGLLIGTVFAWSTDSSPAKSGAPTSSMVA